MVSFFVLTLDVLAVFLQLVAFYFAFKIYQFNRLSRWWLALVFAFLVQAVRRGMQVYSDFGGRGSNIFFDRIMMFTISLLMVVGLIAMLKNFENFDVVAKNVRDKFKKK